MWTLEQGLDLCRKLEVFIKQSYNHYHVALGGSVLHSGISRKDLDVFIYPHKTCQTDRKYLDSKLNNFGFKLVRRCVDTHSVYGDGKEVIEFEYQGKRVDIFFLK